VPRTLRAAALWTVRVGEAAGAPGDLIGAAPGDNRVCVDVYWLLPPAQVAARMELTVSVVAGRVTDIRLPPLLLKAVEGV
jgi:hypothetical protein